MKIARWSGAFGKTHTTCSWLSPCKNDTRTSSTSTFSIYVPCRTLTRTRSSTRPTWWQRFKAAIAEADGVIIVTPEYNWSVPGVLKNALDWCSRGERVFVGKPVLTMGATPGMLGTVRAQLHLREILSSPGIQAKVLPPGGNEVLVNMAMNKFDPEQRRLVDEATLTFLDGVVEKFIAFVQEHTVQPVRA